MSPPCFCYDIAFLAHLQVNMVAKKSDFLTIFWLDRPFLPMYNRIYA